MDIINKMNHRFGRLLKRELVAFMERGEPALHRPQSNGSSKLSIGDRQQSPWEAVFDPADLDSDLDSDSEGDL